MPTMTDPLVLPPLSIADLDSFVGLVEAVRWPHRRADIAALIGTGQGRLVCDGRDGPVLGAGLWWPFGAESARIGLIIVAPDSQGRGVGRRLVERLLADAESRSVMLLATAAGRPLYDKLGFVPIGANTQYQGEYRGAPVPDPRIRPATADDHLALARLDSAALGTERPAVLEHLLEVGRTVVLTDGHAILGYAVARAFGRGSVVGPIVAGSEEDAIALFRAIARPGFVRVDCASEATQLVRHLTEAGLASVGESPVMLRGTWAPPVGPGRVYGLASHAWG